MINEQIMKLRKWSKFGKWLKTTLRWLHKTFDMKNITSCVHIDGSTLHPYATIMPIVGTERVMHKRKVKRKYNIKSGPRLSVVDVSKHTILHEYQTHTLPP